MLGSWPQTQESLPQEDRLVTNRTYLEHSVRFPSFSLSSFRDNNSQREKRRGQWGDFAPCSTFTFIMYSVAMKMGIKLFSPIELGGL